MPAAENIIEMRHITKQFPGLIALDDVSVTIRKGEIFALLGENGAGKSTLMSILFGMYEPDEGEILLRGEKVKITSPRQATQLGIGMVHQHFRLVSNFTAAENIVLGMEPKKRLLGFLPRVDMKKANDDIAALSERYGLKVDPKAVISDLNVSTQQRIEILKMLYRDAEILIYDEPTAVLTPQEIAYLLDIIRGLRDSGKTVILKPDVFEKNGTRLIENYDIRSSRGNRTVTRAMSGGNQQKAIIAREIDLQTPLIIFMQPTRGLDIGAISNIHQQIIAERDRGAAVLLISLELDEIMNCADTIGVIFDGKINRIAKASELTVNEVGRFMMGVAEGGESA